MWQILHASFWKFIKLSNSRLSLNWSIIDEVTTRNTKAYFFGPLCILVISPLCIGVAREPKRLRLQSPGDIFSFKLLVYPIAVVNVSFAVVTM